MSEGTLAAIRSGCQTVAERARFVRINEDRIASYAASMPSDEVTPTLDPAYHYLEQPAAIIPFVLTLDAINFGSGYFPHLRKRPGLSGYFTVAASLTDRFRARGPITVPELEAMTPIDCAGIFSQDEANATAMELMGLFARAWNDLGAWLRTRFDGRFAAPVEASAGSGARLVSLLAEMPFFQDVARYGELEVPFYKRGQITVADLSIALDRKESSPFSDLDQLTIFADNLVPHVLRVDGLLTYDDGLAARIDRGEPIAAGSAEEIEIRAVALHTVERLAAARRDQGHDDTPMRLDYLLWNRGQEPVYKARPRHRTRTVFY